MSATRDPLLRSVRILEGITRLSGVLAAILVVILALLVFYDAFVRYAFNTASIAMQELEWHVFAISFLLAIPYALQKNKHVRLDIFYQHYHPKFQQILWIFVNLAFIMPFSLIILHYGSDFVVLSYQQNEVSESGGLSHRYLIKAVPMLAFFLLFLQAYAEILKSLWWFKNVNQANKEEQKESLEFLS